MWSLPPVSKSERQGISKTLGGRGLLDYYWGGETGLLEEDRKRGGRRVSGVLLIEANQFFERDTSRSGSSEGTRKTITHSPFSPPSHMCFTPLTPPSLLRDRLIVDSVRTGDESLVGGVRGMTSVGGGRSGNLTVGFNEGEERRETVVGKRALI